MSKKPKMVETTAEQFEEFKASVRYYAELLHMGDWHFEFWHDNDFKSNGECWAEIDYHFDSHLANMTLAKEVPASSIGHSDPWRSGKHEVCELLLAQLTYACREQFTGKLVEEWTHAVIRRLERALPGKPDGG